MNKKDRVMTTLNHEEPDALPISELAIDPLLMEAIVGTKMNTEPSQLPKDRRKEAALIDLTERAYTKLGFELIACEPSASDDWIFSPNRDGTVTDEWGRVLSYDTTSKVWIQTGSIFKSMEEFERLEFPDPEASGRMFGIEHMKKRMGDEVAIAGVLRDPFAYAWEMFRITDFVRWLYEKPDFIKRVIERITDFNVKLVKRMIESGVDIIVGDGDYCEKRGPLVPIKFFQDVIFPNLLTQVQTVHKAGLKFIKHTDGNINPILPDLANIVDGLHSLDPTAGVDIGNIKRVYGKRLTLMGNVSVDNLCMKSAHEIAEETRECIRAAASDGGYILSSSNSWYTNAKLENCMAMVDAGRKYGRYPLTN